MPSFSANHISITSTWVVTTGPWTGEVASWGIRVAASKPALTAGQVNLTQFLTSTDAAVDSVSINSRTYTRTKTFSTGQWNSESGKSVTDTDVQALVTAVEKFNNSIKAYYPTNARLQDIKVICPTSDGAAHTGSNVWVPAATMAGGLTGSLPIEDALCVSLYTAHLTKSGRGRFYIGPLGAGMLGSYGELNSTSHSALVTQAQTLCNELRAVSPTNSVDGYTPIVWSRIDKTKGSVVNRVRVGDEFDQHETRGKQRAETFISANVS